MLEKVREHEAGTLDDGHILLQLYEMGRKMTVLAGGGALCGFFAGVITTVCSFLRFCLLKLICDTFRYPCANSKRATGCQLLLPVLT